MVFNPSVRSKIVSNNFLNLLLNDQPLLYVNSFKYLGHIITNDFKDNDDIKREIKLLFIRTNVLKRRYSNCSLNVKKVLF